MLLWTWQGRYILVAKMPGCMQQSPYFRPVGSTRQRHKHLDTYLTLKETASEACPQLIHRSYANLCLVKIEINPTRKRSLHNQIAFQLVPCKETDCQELQTDQIMKISPARMLQASHIPQWHSNPQNHQQGFPLARAFKINQRSFGLGRGHQYAYKYARPCNIRVPTTAMPMETPT